MIATENNIFKGDKFAIQVIAKGSYIDNGVGDGSSYTVEATTIRLNHVALNKWSGTHQFNCRNVYADGPEGDAEYDAYKARVQQQLDFFNAQIMSDLRINPDQGGILITQSQAEVFTVVQIWENEPAKEDKPEPTQYPRMTPYERTQAAVYATGNKWAIENFNATH